MFLLKKVGNIVCDPNKEDLIQIPSGQLYLVRPRSPKGPSECVFKDAVATIRRTTIPFNYQLAITRAYEEGEEQLLEEEEEDGDDLQDERTFLLGPELHFTIFDSGDGAKYKTLAWTDINGEMGDTYQFITPASTAAKDFEVVAFQCMWERNHKKSHESASPQEIEAYRKQMEQAEGDNLAQNFKGLSTDASVEGVVKRAAAASGSSPSSKGSRNASKPGDVSNKPPAPIIPPKSSSAPEAGNSITSVSAELHLFDAANGVFTLQDANVTASVKETGSWTYWLSIVSDNNTKNLLAQELLPEMNPVFNFEHKAFIWNYYDSQSRAYSWLLKFKERKTLEEFQHGLMQALWERLNETRWQKSTEQEREYVLDAFQDPMDVDGVVDDEEEEEVSESGEFADAQSEQYSDDEDFDAEKKQPADGEENSQLEVGYKHDRSFVSRGDKIGVFKHTNDNTLQFVTTIDKIQNMEGKAFTPKKMLLHNTESDMILQDPNNSKSLYRMDLETGKVIEEWGLGGVTDVKTFTPQSKFSQMTAEQTLVGISHNSLYKIDPRLSGSKLAAESHKQYLSKNDFSTATTTNNGYIAVASAKGDIRLFDRVGINAKTALPALGEPISGVDVTNDGKWLLATCKTYLLLIDTTVKEGKYAGESGFKRSFGKDKKPRPIRLQLKPEHVASMEFPLSFTAAKFNTGEKVEESSIVTSSGPYVFTWNFKAAQKGRNDYKIKLYDTEVKGDNFKFGTDKNLIIALPNDVTMIAKQTLHKPTRESLSTPTKNLRSRSSIVNSPY